MSADALYDAKVADAAAAAKATADAAAAQAAANAAAQAAAAEAARIAAAQAAADAAKPKWSAVLDGVVFTDQIAYTNALAVKQGGIDAANALKAAADSQASAQQFAATQNAASMAFSQQQSTDAQNAANAKDRQSAFDILMSEFSGMGLATLVEPLRGMLLQNVSPGEFAVRLTETQAYKDRFAANAARAANGLKILKPGDYLAAEDGYRQTLRAYGLTQFDNDAYVQKFIENDMSPTEFNTRVVDAVQRIQMADPSIKNTLKQYYGFNDAQLTAYILDPKQSLQDIERKIASGEIGAAASMQNLNIGAATAEDLAAYGVTQNQARAGYQTISDVLPGANKLSSIYGSTLDSYGQTQAEQEVFKGSASAKRAREKLAATEQGTFTGSSGTAKGAFSTGYLNKDQASGQF